MNKFELNQKELSLVSGGIIIKALKDIIVGTVVGVGTTVATGAAIGEGKGIWNDVQLSDDEWNAKKNKLIENKKLAKVKCLGSVSRHIDNLYTTCHNGVVRVLRHPIGSSSK